MRQAYCLLGAKFYSAAWFIVEEIKILSELIARQIKHSHLFYIYSSYHDTHT